MLCYKNGSLARERVRDAAAGGSWSTFSRLLEDSSPGNDGCVGFYHYLPEITPAVSVAAVRRFTADGASVPEFDSPAVRVSWRH